jgi:hypothetical protein
LPLSPKGEQGEDYVLFFCSRLLLINSTSLRRTLVLSQQWATNGTVNVNVYKDIKLCRKGNRKSGMGRMFSSE